MFDSQSRYYQIETVTLTRSDGTVVSFKRRRFIPGIDAVAAAEVVAGQGERYDQIAARVLGFSEQFWRLCDANRVLDPRELERVGRRIRVVIGPEKSG